MSCAIDTRKLPQRNMKENTRLSLNGNCDKKLPSFSSLVLSFSSDSEKSADQLSGKDGRSLYNLSQFGGSISSVTSTPCYVQSPHNLNVRSLDSIYFSGPSPFRSPHGGATLEETKPCSERRLPIDYRFPMPPSLQTPSYSAVPEPTQQSAIANDQFRFNTIPATRIKSLTPQNSPKRPIVFDSTLRTPPKDSRLIGYDYTEGITKSCRNLLTSFDAIGSFHEKLQTAIEATNSKGNCQDDVTTIESDFAAAFFSYVLSEDMDKALLALQETYKICYRLKNKRREFEHEKQQKKHDLTISKLQSPIQLGSPIRLRAKKVRSIHKRKSSTLNIPGIDIMPLTVNPIKVEDWEKYNLQTQGGLNVELSIKKEIVCLHCGIKSTPEWRKGPDGNRSLCNACGLFFSKLVKKHGTELAASILRERKQKNMILDRRV